MKKLILYLISLVFMVNSLWATHNRAGEITYKHDPLPGQPHRFTFEIVTYTKASSTDADRDSLTILWGNNNDESTLPRVNGNGNGEIVPNRDDIKKNIYRGSYSYPGASTYYVVSVADPNRNADIININDGNSVDVQFFLEDTLFLINPQFYGYNNSPSLFQPPVDNGQIGEIFKHNPNAFDIDGDSLVFELTVPLQTTNSAVPNYQFPNEIGVGADNVISLDANTGEFIWDSPQIPGEYNIAFMIREFRNGVQIGTMIRDMQVLIENVNNTAPELSIVNDTCVTVGQTLTIPITATESEDAPSAGQIIELSAYGGPFELPITPANFAVLNEGVNQANAIFNWNIVCDHIYSDEYIVVFKAEDNYIHLGNPLPLSDLVTWLISVVPPPIENLTTEAQAGKIILNWGLNNDYACADSEEFLGFSVWRKSACDDAEFDLCDNDLQANGYVLLAKDLKNYTYTDLTAQPGINYVYRITARFADVVTQNNDPLNFSQSAPSEGVCESLPRDLPTILNVSVANTSTSNGEMYLRWAKPNPVDLDTLINLPPYTYELMRSENNTTNFTTIASFTANSFAQANDTVFTDTNLNTQANTYFYKIKFITGNFTLGDTPVASSLFINTTPTDNQVLISWNEQVPWLNQTYTVFRQQINSNTFEEIATTNTQNFTDTNLTNGTEYCYYVQSSGTYNAADLPTPLINLSQQRCDTPIDTTPPCAPNLVVSNDCAQDPTTQEPLNYDSNLLTWNLLDAQCAEDAEQFTILYQAPNATNFETIQTLDNPSIRSFLHQVQGTLAGCYAVTAIDSFNNQSLYSNIVCAETCLQYELPNTFTPNADSKNDLFVPLSGYRFVNKIDMNIFTKWGNLVFATQDPNINWDGKEQNSQKDLPSDTYYYTCKVFELSSNGTEIIAKQLSGYIHLFRE